MKLYLIRHGQTDWNLAGRIQGRTDIPLNDTGKLQAKALVEAMESRPVARVFASPLKRAMQTAMAVSAAQKVPLIQVPEFQEVDFGLWEGLTWEQVRERYPREFDAWYREPVEHTPVGGETKSEAAARCRIGLKKLLACGDEDAALVAHGAILAYICDALFENGEKPPELIVKNASITTVELDPVQKTARILESNITK